ncbi:hypothetical protein Slash_97 [Bacillus phage Slash]|uniref:Uncharacterized protein n=1 Tax=Bacillus phage Slash TaxID=1406790 RepID=U5PX65_9CAUD|nr:hypothetical protein Slash_97 [Bacillus phage Slash]AGY48386.1 hypothetical protein Slash_97 [Bacillus phage Slash]
MMDMMNNEIFAYKRKYYAMDSGLDGNIMVVQARNVPGGKRMIEAVYQVETKDKEYVKNLIRSGEIRKHKLTGK